MKNYKNTLLLFLILTVSLSFAQSKKTIKDLKIKSVYTEVTETKKDKIDFKRTKNLFDSDGNTISEIELDRDSSYKNYDTYSYNNHNDVTEHFEYDKKGRLIKKTVSNYDNLNDKLSEITYDSSNVIIEKVKIHYNNFGQKDEEITYSADEKIKKKIIFKYDNKGSLIEKLIYNEKGEIVYNRKSVYQYSN